MKLEDLLKENGGLLRRIAELEEIELRLTNSEQALRESEERFRTLYENAPLAYQSLDENGNYLEVNQAWLGSLGYSRDEVIGKWCGDFLTAAYREKFRAYFQEFKAKGAIHGIEFEMARKDGSTILVSAHGKIGRDAQGQFRQTHCILHDITERKKTEEALDRANEEWERTFNAISDGIMVLDDQHRIIRANKTMADALGMPERELIGKLCYELVHGDKKPPVFCPYSQVLADGEEHSAEVVEPRLGGILDVRACPILDQNGKVIGSVHVTRYITERKQSENILLARFRLMQYATSHSLDELLQATLDEVEVLTNSLIGFYHFVDADQETLYLQAWSKRTLREFCNAEGRGLHYSIDEAGVWVDCVRQRRAVIHNDYSALPHRKGMPEGHADVIRELVVPVFRGDRIVAILGVGNKPIDYDARDIESVSLLADLAWDIAERKQAEEALRESQERLELALQGADLGLWDWHVHTGQAVVNQRSAELVGYALDQMEPSLGFWQSLLHPDDRQRAVEKVFNHLTGSTDYYEDEYRVRHKSGDWKWILSRGRVTERAPDGKPSRMTGTYLNITDKKLAESQASEANELRERIVSESPVGIAVYRADGQCISANEALARTVGADTERLLIQNFRTLSSWQDSGLLVEAEQVLAGGANYQREVHLTSTFGRNVWVNARMARILTGGEPHLLIVFNDITDRRIVEDALKFEREQLLSLFESINEVILVIDPITYEILYANKFTEDLFGKQLIGGVCHERLYGFDVPCRHCLNEKILELRGKSRQWEYSNPILKKDFLATDRIVRWPDGRDVKFHLAVDITERKRAEEKNLWLAAIVESSEDAIIGKTLDGIITSWNKGATQIYGYQDTEAVGKPISLLVPPVRQGEVSQFLERIKRGGHIEHYETVRQQKGGREIDVSLSISPIRDAEGRVIGASTIARYITEQKILQRQLLQAQKMESIGTLAGGIAHDFNNLLHVIIGYSDMLLFNRKPSDPAYEGLRAIRHAGKDGAELAKRILGFSRRLEPNSRPVNLNNEIIRIRKMLERTIPKMIRIDILLADNLMTVNADPGQIEQILLNLAVNAQHAMPDRGLLTIATANVTLDEGYSRAHLEVEPGEYVILTVSDTGHGMDKEVMEHIFEPFYTTKGPGVGTGLGLAMVFGIVKSHKGHITCYSEPGTGTTFKIYLPAIVQEVEQDPATTQQMPPPGTETILLVDDEKAIRTLGEEMLRMAGYKVLMATNGIEALEVYRSNQDRIALVLLDLMMPEMSGKQCLQELHKINPEVKVVIASGYSADAVTQEVLASGAKGFANKPYNLRQLLEVVRKILDAV